MSIEQWWNDTDRGKPKYSEKTVSVPTSPTTDMKLINLNILGRLSEMSVRNNSIGFTEHNYTLSIWTVVTESRWGDEIFHTRPHQPWCLPSILYSVYWVYPGGKAAGAWCWPPTPSSAEIKGRVELCIYAPSGPSWFLLGWTLLYCTLKSFLSLLLQLARKWSHKYSYRHFPPRPLRLSLYTLQPSLYIGLLTRGSIQRQGNVSVGPSTLLLSGCRRSVYRDLNLTTHVQVVPRLSKFRTIPP